MNQQRFAEVLGVTVMTVSRWETGLTAPKGLSALILTFLGNVVRLHPRQTLLDTLRKVGSEPLPLVRMLAWLKRHPSIPSTPPDPPG
jgi:transcriptional regulator with XRE-family HTH domain